MNCPLCLDSVLDVTFHAGIELDICPRCRGVWLDRGELDRIAADATSKSPGPRSDSDRTRSASIDHTDRNGVGDELRGRRPDDARSTRRKKSLASRLGDVFEEIIDL